MWHTKKEMRRKKHEKENSREKMEMQKGKKKHNAKTSRIYRRNPISGSSADKQRKEEAKQILLLLLSKIKKSRGVCLRGTGRERREAEQTDVQRDEGNGKKGGCAEKKKN